jgi:hypothetical protein
MRSNYCSKCHTVYIGKSDICCNSPVEIFDPCKHGEYLVSGSNSWHIVHNKWKDHPIYEYVSDVCDLTSAPQAMNRFIQYLIDNQRGISCYQQTQD